MKRLAALAITMVLAAPNLLAWTPKTRVKMVDEAIRLMPGSLSLALTQYQEEVRRGAVEPMVAEDEPTHRPPWDEGSLDAEVAARAEALVREVEEMPSFVTVARRFGELAHFVADAGFPPGAAGESAAGHYAHFSEFCESRLDRFPLVFYGHDDANLDNGEFRAFALSALERSRSEDGQLMRTYAVAGDPPNPALFDDRSVPFAVGSLSYSHTVTNIVRAWVAAWERAGGDTGRTPYRKPTRSSSDKSEPDGRP